MISAVAQQRKSRIAARLPDLAHINDGANDLHSRDTGDIRYDVLKLQFREPQCFLHVLYMRRRVLEMPFREAEDRHVAPRSRGRDESSFGSGARMQSLQPLSVIHVGLGPRTVLISRGLASTTSTPRSSKISYTGTQYTPRRLHRNGAYSDLNQPICQTLESAVKA